MCIAACVVSLHPLNSLYMMSPSIEGVHCLSCFSCIRNTSWGAVARYATPQAAQCPACLQTTINYTVVLQPAQLVQDTHCKAASWSSLGSVLTEGPDLLLRPAVMTSICRVSRVRGIQSAKAVLPWQSHCVWPDVMHSCVPSPQQAALWLVM